MAEKNRLRRVEARYVGASKNFMKFEIEGDDDVVLSTKIYIRQEAEQLPTHIVIKLDGVQEAKAEIAKKMKARAKRAKKE